MIDIYDKYEMIGRELFKEFISQLSKASDLQFDTVKDSRTDCSFFINGNKYIGEIKVRGEWCKQFPTLLLETEKYNAIKAKSKDSTGLYINFIGQDELYIFDLKNINSSTCTVENKFCKKKTIECTEDVLKQVIMIPKNIGLHFKKVQNQWKKA